MFESMLEIILGVGLMAAAMFLTPVLVSHSVRLANEDGSQKTVSLKQSTALLGNAQELQDDINSVGK